MKEIMQESQHKTVTEVNFLTTKTLGTQRFCLNTENTEIFTEDTEEAS